MLPGIRSALVVVAPVLATVLMAGLAFGCASAASTAGGDTTVGSVIATTIASSSVRASAAVGRPDVGATTQTSLTPTEESRTSSEPPTPSTTLPPGVMTFASFTMRFEQLVEREDLEGTLPYSVMAAGFAANVLLMYGLLSFIILFSLANNPEVAIAPSFIIGFGIMVGIPLGLATGVVDLASWTFVLWYFLGTALAWVGIGYLLRMLTRENIVLSSKGE